jgi:hypothetical protein
MTQPSSPLPTPTRFLRLKRINNLYQLYKLISTDKSPEFRSVSGCTPVRYKVSRHWKRRAKNGS